MTLIYCDPIEPVYYDCWAGAKKKELKELLKDSKERLDEWEKHNKIQKIFYGLRYLPLLAAVGLGIWVFQRLQMPNYREMSKNYKAMTVLGFLGVALLSVIQGILASIAYHSTQARLREDYEMLCAVKEKNWHLASLSLTSPKANTYAAICAFNIAMEYLSKAANEEDMGERDYYLTCVGKYDWEANLRWAGLYGSNPRSPIERLVLRLKPAYYFPYGCTQEEVRKFAKGIFKEVKQINKDLRKK